MITFIDEKGTEHSALVAYSVTNAVNGELSVKGTIYTNDKVLHGIGRGWRFRLDDEYYRITYAKPNDTGRQIEVEFDAVHQFFYDMSKSMVYTILNGSKPFETYLQAIFSGSGYTYNLETTVGSIRKENFGNKSRLSLFNDIIKAAGLEFSVRGHVIRILKRVGTDLSTIVRKDFNMNELKIEKDINSFVTYQRGLGAWKDDEDHSKGRYETSYESPLSAIYGRIEADPVVDERYKDTGKLLERLKENVDKSYKVSVEIDMEDLSQAGYRISRPNPGDYIMAINETLGFRQKVRIVSFTSEYDVGGNLISRKVVCNDIGTVQRATSEISHLSRTLTDSIEGSERALKTATRALVSADGKNTNHFGDVKPLDVPKGTLRKGDRLFLTVGDKKQLYFWNGAEWELEPTEFDHEKFDMEFNRKSQEIKKVIQENRQKAEEALRNAGASSLLAQEAKKIGDQTKSEIDNLRSSSQTVIEQIESFKTQYGTKLNEVKSTADGLFTKLGAIETYVNKDGQRQESLQRYARDESARQVSAIREQISRDYVGKSAYQEDVRGLERRFSAISTQTNNDIATKISQYKQTVDGRFANLTSQIAGKANQTDFQRVRETSQLYERIIGINENDISNKVARMAMTNKLFQVEVAKNEGLKTIQRQIAGSWAVQNINSAGDLISGINLGANGHNRFVGKLTHITGETLIDKAVIKSAMVDKLKTANFEAGSVTTTILDTEAVTADKVLMDQAFANKLVASNIFTDMLAAKEAFINKLRSVVVTANLFEGFQGLIGGFRFGQYKNRNGYFITGTDSVSVGMGNGANAGANRNAFWANWGNNLDIPGPKAWYVNTDGKMYCRNDVDFYSKVDFASTSKVNFYSRINAARGIWIGYDDVEGEGDNPDGGYNRVVWWSQIVTGNWRQHAGITTGSDIKLKENIEPTSVKALDKINALNLVAFDYIKDKTHEEIGLIAQEVLDIIPGAVEKYEGEDNHLTINYSKFVPYLTKAIQELNQKLEEVA